MKKSLLLMPALALAMALAGCSGGNSAEDRHVDIDLSQASDTVIYAQVCNMYVEPGDYLGQVVRVPGTLDFYINGAGQECSMITVQDATACCGQSLEFIWNGNGSSDVSWPDFGDEVVVTGRFETYDSEGYSYIHLVDADMEWELY